MPYARYGDVVTLTLTRDQFDGLVLALGMATGVASRDGHPTESWLALANAVNEGNPNWRPYLLSAPDAAPNTTDTPSRR